MGKTLLEIADWVELESFFSGYLLLFVVIYFIATKLYGPAIVNAKLLSRLPKAYALVGSCYFGLQVMNLYPDYHFSTMISESPFIYLKIWGLLAVLFWIPFFRNKIILSAIHNLVFFILIIISFYTQLFSSHADSNTLMNNAKIYSASLLVNLIAFGIVTLISIGFAKLNLKRSIDEN